VEPARPALGTVADRAEADRTPPRLGTVELLTVVAAALEMPVPWTLEERAVRRLIPVARSPRGARTPREAEEPEPAVPSEARDAEEALTVPDGVMTRRELADQGAWVREMVALEATAPASAPAAAPAPGLERLERSMAPRRVAALLSPPGTPEERTAEPERTMAPLDRVVEAPEPGPTPGETLRTPPPRPTLPRSPAVVPGITADPPRGEMIRERELR
jgi:hypothetical protein